ncbi:MAG: ankyrin repeat domain-containing protein [Candidatus Amoebophilus sp.]
MVYTSKNYTYLSLSYILSLLLLFSNVSCKCGNFKQGKPAKQGRHINKKESLALEKNSLSIKAHPDKLIGDSKKTKLAIQLIDISKEVQLDEIILKSTLIHQDGNGSQLNYTDVTGETHKMSDLASQLAVFNKHTILHAKARLLEIEVEILPGPAVKEVTYRFELLNNVGKYINSCEVNWKEQEAIIQDVIYVQTSQELICIFKNIGPKALENIQLNYTSQTDRLKLAEEILDKGTINTKNIATLPIGTMTLSLGKLKLDTQQLAKIEVSLISSKNKILFHPKTYTLVNPGIKLDFKNLYYNASAKSIVYQVSNLGTLPGHKIQVKYKNISKSIEEQQVNLNGEKEQTVDIEDLDTGTHTAFYGLPINFKGQKHAEFSFSILYAGVLMVHKELICENELADNAIYQAIEKENFNEVLKLIENAPFDAINYQDPVTKDTPLLLAAQLGHQSIIEALLKAGVNVNTQGGDGRTALLCAAIDEKKDIVEALIKSGVDLDIQHGDEALLHAVYKGYKDIVKALLDAGVDANTQGGDGRTALMESVSNSWKLEGEKIVALLLNNGANINVQDQEGNTALMYATFGKNQAIVEALLNRGARIDLKNTLGETALWGAFDRENTSMLKLLFKRLDKHIQINQLGKFIHHALPWAIRRGAKEIVEELLNRGAELNSSDEWNTNLIEAIINKQPEIIKLLLEKGAKVDDQNNKGETALMCAVQEGDIDTVSTLLEQGTDVNKKDLQGFTALMYIVKRMHGIEILANKLTNEDILEKLLEAGADINISNGDGETALYLANDKPEIKNLLERHLARARF